MDDFDEIIEVINSVKPYFGMAGSILSSYRLKRLEGLIKRLEQAKSIAFAEFLKSEIGFQLLETVAERVWREHSERKRDRYANLIVSAWIDDRPNETVYDEAALFSDAIHEFTENHITVLQKLFDERTGQSISYADLGTFGGDEKLIVMESLCARFAMVRRSWNLDRPEVKSRVMFSSNLSPEGISRKCFHKIAPLGERFILHVIKKPEVEPEQPELS